MFPRIAGVKVESWWGHGRQAIVRCTARLTRVLTAREAARLGDAIAVDVDGNRVHYTCRPEEVEEREEHLAKALENLGGRGRRKRGSRRKTIVSTRPAPSPATS